jgi:DNA-binding CsgD family transcriptional regulator
MGNVRDATWRFINVAPIMTGQAALDDLFADTLRPFGVDRFDCTQLYAGDDGRYVGYRFFSDRGLSAWTQYYFEQGYDRLDPIAPACAQFSGAYTWSDVKARSDGRADGRMWADARAAGMGEGLIVPMAPRRLTEATVRLTTPEDRFDPDFIPLLQSISVVFASSTASFSLKAADLDDRAQTSKVLTEREVECLHWSARGKTNAEIGVIIRVSRHTVNTHIESAKTKLGVATRVQAVAIAYRLGLLSIA